MPRKEAGLGQPQDGQGLRLERGKALRISRRHGGRPRDGDHAGLQDVQEAG
jgi:hypothetical protein